MRTKNAKRPGHLGDGRAAKIDRFQEPITDKSTREAQIRQAAEWYVAHRHDALRPLIPNLVRRFDLTAAEAAKALACAGRVA